MKKYKVEMHVGNEWSSNQMKFNTKEEAEEHAKDLFSRWTLPDKWRVVEVKEEK